MGMRFRKSFKIAPGVKVNLNKKSSSITFGGKGAHYTVNSKGKRTTSVGIPGTGLYYTETSTNSKQTKENREEKAQNMSKENSNKKSKGCLSWIIIFILICIAISLYSFCWIPAIPALIYFLTSKKYQEHKARNSAICGGVLITSLIVFIWLGSPSKLDSITVDWGSEKFYIGDTVEVKVTGFPSDAEIDKLELSENMVAKLKYSDGKAIVSFVDDGEASLFFTANDEVTSNTQKITVIDKVAEEQEKKAKEEAERLAAEQAAAEEAQKAQEEAERLAAEQAAAEQTAEPQEEMVWIPSSGSKYHSNSGCSGMNNPRQVPLSEAQSMGFTPCQRCH